ncbi:MAG: cupredoxin domain-containing protein [Myxococcaceae bacterium]
MVPSTAPVAAAPAPAPKRLELAVTTDGFVPANLTVKANQPVTLAVTRKTDETCATELLIEGTSIKAELPLDKTVEVAWTPTKTGKVKFGCAMDMMIGGVLLVE